MGGTTALKIENSHDVPLTATAQDLDPIDPLEKALRRIRRTKDFPTISKYVIEINQKISDHSIQSSASELANIILKDYALTNKLLKLVNSAFYGFVAGKVTTVTRAVVLLGYDNVRLAAISLVLFEHFKCKSSARDLKDATISSFWCGLLAKEIARMQYLIDPEEAFICALLHNLGKLLTIYHMPNEFREIKYQVTQRDAKETKAVKQVLGVSYKALSIAVAKQWNFPERIYGTMVSLTAEQLEDKNKRIQPLCALSNFTDALCRIIAEVRWDRRDAAMENLLDRYSGYVTISFKQLKTLMASCLDGLHKHSDALQLSLDESEFLMRLTGRNPEGKRNASYFHEFPGQDSKHGEQGQGAFRLADGEQICTGAMALEGDDAVSIIMGGIQEINSVMLGNHEINDVALLSLEIIYRALQCNRTILFINDSREKAMAARFGYGAGIQRIVGKVRFDISSLPGQPDLFSQSIQSGKDLIVEDAHAPELHRLIPGWYQKHIDAKAFVFLPIAYQNVCVGAYYADLDFIGPPISPLDHKYLSMLRNQLILAIKMGR
jgi:HD-like signal output (HDOD) protein